MEDEEERPSESVVKKSKGKGSSGEVAFTFLLMARILRIKIMLGSPTSLKEAMRTSNVRQADDERTYR